MHENSPQSIHFAKIFLGGGGGGGMPPDPSSMGRLHGSHMGFLHKLGNPLPQILDPPLNCLSTNILHKRMIYHLQSVVPYSFELSDERYYGVLVNVTTVGNGATFHHPLIAHTVHGTTCMLTGQY